MHVSYLECVIQRNYIGYCVQLKSFLSKAIQFDGLGQILILLSPSYFGLLKNSCTLPQAYSRSLWQVTCRITLRSAVSVDSVLGF